MMAGGWGGARVGSGRKKKPVAVKVLQGTATRQERTRAASLPAVTAFESPADLTADERLVWARLAPHAFKARTLTAGMEYQFVMLCRNIVLERELALNPDTRGGANHRGILQRIDAQLLRFALSPIGKPLIEETPTLADPFSEFDGRIN